VRLGVFGGTFDPPHLGHLIAAQEAWYSLGLDQVLLVPARHPPHKDPAGLSPAPVRLELLEAAVGDDRRFSVSELELARSGPSYTVDTLEALHGARPDSELYLLLGADQYRELEGWREPARIRELARVCVFGRQGDEPAEAGVRTVPIPRVDVSSTAVRERVRRGEPIRYLVAPAVERLIRERGLYGAARGSGPGPAGQG
jgi:nicotinate-nucleotide adenylyltransferase